MESRQNVEPSPSSSLGVQLDMNQKTKYKHHSASVVAWRTPLYSLDDIHIDENQHNATADALISESSYKIPAAIRVPSSGLYGFIFGRKSHAEEFEVNKQESNKGSSSKGRNTLLVHCGCTYKASFTLHNTTSTMNAFTRTNNDSNNDDDDENDKGAVEPESILLPLPSPTYDNKVITSTRVAKVFYIPKDTNVSITSVSSCNDEKKHQNGWVWGLVNQKYHDSDRIMTSSSPPEKKAKNDICHSMKGGQGQVQFNPTESKKKSLLCTECVRKFPTCQAVKNHCITNHAPKLGEDQGTCVDDDYLDLVGHKIFRTPLCVAYEDDDLVIIVKPQGVPVQGQRFTLPKSDLLMPFKSKLGRSQDLSKPRIAHRLDAATGGLLVVAKTSIAEAKIKKSFEQRLCKKRYRAIVFGKLKQNEHPYSKLDVDEDEAYSRMGTINTPLSGKASVTHYQIVEYTRCDHELANGFITTVDLFPVTGRQHQLRKHLKLIGHPIWGDTRYAAYSADDKSAIKAQGIDADKKSTLYIHSKMCLWALEISFPHPCENRMVDAQIKEPAWYKFLTNSVCEREQMKIDQHVSK